MRAVLAIAGNTFREAIRDRILYLFIGFAVVMVVSSKLFGLLTVGDETKIIKDIGMIKLEIVQHSNLRSIVDKLAAFVKESRVILIALDDHVLPLPNPVTAVEIFHGVQG